MRRYLKVFFLLVFFVFLFSKITFAQEENKRWVCLKAVRCIEPGANCKGTTKKAHRARLTTKQDSKPLPNADTYVVECIATNSTGGQICTTGNSEADLKIYKQDNSHLTTPIEYDFIGMYKGSDGETPAANPTKSDATGEIGPFEWVSDTLGTKRARKFLALNFFTPQTDETDENGQSEVGQGGQQQGALEVGTAETTEEPPPSTDCVSIEWDPYGRVFDSKTLEPVIDALVRLEDKDGNKVTRGDLPGGSIKNPYRTLADGAFSFVVPDGTYKLNLLPESNPNLVFPSQSSLHPNWSKIYSNIYPQNTGYEIVQQGTIQQRDISVDLKTPQQSDPQLMEFFQDLNKVTNEVIIEGRVSHPLTIIEAYSIKNNSKYKLLKTEKSDKYGHFKIVVDQSGFEPTEEFGEINLKETDLTGTLAKKIKEFFIKITNAQTVAAASTTVRFNPIPNNLEGYTFDSLGKVIPLAQVEIYLTFSKNPYYRTKADEKGFFKITSKDLPTMAYTIKYTSPTGFTNTVTTSKFIQQNAKYLSSNNVNLNTYKDSKGNPLEKPSADKKNQSSAQAESKSAQPNYLTIILILVGLILAVAVIIGIYIYKKRRLASPGV